MTDTIWITGNDGKRRFHASAGAPFSEEEAQPIGEHLDELAAQGIEMTPDGVLPHAAKMSSPLYPYVEWDDSIAAHKWRKHEVRQIFNHLEVQYVDVQTEEERNAPAFVSLHVSKTNDDGEIEYTRCYVQTQEVVEQPDLREQAIEQALRQLRHWQGQYKMYNEFDALHSAIDELLNGAE